MKTEISDQDLVDGQDPQIRDYLPLDQQLEQIYGEGASKGILSVGVRRKRLDTSTFQQIAYFKDPDHLPEWGEIQEKFGGGEYELYVRFKDPRTSQPNLKRFYQDIAGDPIIPGKNEKPVIQQNGKSLTDQVKEVKEIAAAFNPVPVPGGSSNLEIQLIMKQFESTTQLILKMFDTLGKNKSSDGGNETLINTLITLVTSLIQNISNKADPMAEINTTLEIMDRLKGEAETGSMGEKLVEKLIDGLPMLAAAWESRKHSQMSPGAIDAPVRVIPQTSPEKPKPGAILIEKSETKAENIQDQNILQENLMLKAKLFEMEYNNAVNDTMDVFDDLPGVTEDTEQPNIFENLTIDDMNQFQLLGQLAQYAPKEKKVETLVTFLQNKYAIWYLKFFCLKYNIVKDAEEFESILTEAQKYIS